MSDYASNACLPEDKLRERTILLKRFLPHIDWMWPNEVKTMITSYLAQHIQYQPKLITIEALARDLTDEQLEHIVMNFSPYREYYSFRGKYYTIKKGYFHHFSSWDEVKESVRQVLKTHGKKGYAMLKALVEVDEAPFELIAARASEIYGDRIYPSRLIAELRDRWDLAWEVGSRQYPRWAMPGEVKQAVVKILDEFEAQPIPRLSTKDAETEFLEVIEMDEEFKSYLRVLTSDRLERVINFGKEVSPSFLINYLQDLYGPVLFFDHLLSITQQYSICDAEVVNQEGSRALSSGFNLALFGEPGTGKTFAVKDVITGNEELGVTPHGLPGINRYCGGMTPAKFIAIGEAYTGRRFNFIVTEFNDWFKYKGMVEPLKLAMERGTIRYETKTYTVGPYRFTSFFAVNYNTQIYDRGYEVTVSDPNFNAIEDRMLCRLHRLTKEKYQELSKSQRELMLGRLQAKMMKVAPQLRDHLTLVYAIQTKDPHVAESFYEKKVLITKNMLNMLDKATSLVLENLETKTVPFSMRLERRAIQLASAMSLLNYFNTKSDVIPIDDTAAKMATQFFVEEAWIRSNEAFPLYEVLRKLALDLPS